MIIIETIKKIRKELGYTQSQIANYLNIAQTTYADIENNKIQLKVEDFIKICKFLQVDPIMLLKDTNSIIISITNEEAKILNQLNEKVQQNFSFNNISINTSGDVIIGQNIEKK